MLTLTKHAHHTTTHLPLLFDLGNCVGRLLLGVLRLCGDDVLQQRSQLEVNSNGWRIACAVRCGQQRLCSLHQRALRFVGGSVGERCEIVASGRSAPVRRMCWLCCRRCIGEQQRIDAGVHRHRAPPALLLCRYVLLNCRSVHAYRHTKHHELDTPTIYTAMRHYTPQQRAGSLLRCCARR